MVDSPVNTEFLRRAFFAKDPILYRRSLPALRAKSSFLEPSKTSSIMPCSISIYRAGPTILGLRNLLDLDSTDLAIDELLIPPPPLRLRLPLALQMAFPMSLTTPSPLDSRDSAIDANPSLLSLSVPFLLQLPGMSPIALGTSLCPRMLEDDSASPDTGMRIGSPPSPPKNPRGCLIPWILPTRYGVSEVQTRKPFSESIRRGLACHPYLSIKPEGRSNG